MLLRFLQFFKDVRCYYYNNDFGFGYTSENLVRKNFTWFFQENLQIEIENKIRVFLVASSDQYQAWVVFTNRHKISTITITRESISIAILPITKYLTKRRWRWMKIKGGGGGVLQPFYFWWRRKILARELTLTTAQAFFFKILHTLHELVWSLVWKIFLDPNFSFTFTQNKICASFLRTLSLSLGAGLSKTQDRAWSWSYS